MVALFLKEENVAKLKENGIVFCLTASPEEIFERVGHQTHRPLLQTPDPLETIQMMLDERAPYYAHADYTMDTTGRSFDEIVAHIKNIYFRKIKNLRTQKCRISNMEKTLHVELKENRYPIIVGAGHITRIAECLKSLNKSTKVLIVTDTTVQHHYAPIVLRSLKQAGFDVDLIEVPVGESSKSLEQLTCVVDSLVAHQLDRSSVLIALGGGVVGDLAGFAAAVYMRGIDYIQIPTTLQAQVDASVGGKTAINHEKGKNLIGAFHQPKLVLIDVDYT